MASLASRNCARVFTKNSIAHLHFAQASPKEMQGRLEAYWLDGPKAFPPQPSAIAPLPTPPPTPVLATRPTFTFALEDFGLSRKAMDRTGPVMTQEAVSARMVDQWNHILEDRMDWTANLEDDPMAEPEAYDWPMVNQDAEPDDWVMGEPEPEAGDWEMADQESQTEADDGMDVDGPGWNVPTILPWTAMRQSPVVSDDDE